MNLIDSFYRLQQEVTVIVSPVSSWVKMYHWEEGQESVLVTVDSNSKTGKNVCALFSIQNAVVSNVKFTHDLVKIHFCFSVHLNAKRKAS